MANGPPSMPRPPYREEGILGSGARKFIAALLAIAVVAGIAVLALTIDFGGLTDELEQATEEPTEQPAGGGGSSGSEEPSADENADGAPPATLSAGGLAAALEALREELGGNPDLVRVQATPDGIELDVRRGNQLAGYRWSEGELSELQVVVVAGTAPLKERDFRASEVEPASLGRLLRGAEQRSGGRQLDVINASLEQDLVGPRLRWLLNAQAPNGSSLTFRAQANGRGIEQLGASGPPGAGLPPQAQRQLRDAQRSSECIQNAGGDPEAISACVERFLP